MHLEKTNSKSVELVEQGFDCWLLEQGHVLRDNVADRVTETLILLRCGSEGMMSRPGKLVTVLVRRSCPLKLLLSKISQTNDVVFVGHLVHLRVHEHLASITLSR